MFKKLIILFLAIFYLNVSSGLGIHFHYCMGQLVSWAIGHQEGDHHACDRCGMDMEKNACCKEELVILKLNDSHQPASVYAGASKLLFSPYSFNYPEKNNFFFLTNPTSCIYSGGKDPDVSLPIRYIFIRVLRI